MWKFVSFLLIIIAYYSCKTALACGPVTHIEISYRALYNYYDTNNDDTLARQNQDALEAGNAYPDAMYPDICFDGKYHDIAEDTHWTPFINASINYIQKKYPKPWDESTQKLVAFVMGVLSHQVADVSWHSLGIDQGFLRGMAGTNYHGDFPSAHSDGDLGGEVMNIFQLNLQYSDLVGEWYVPVPDLVGIYQELYGKERITEDVIVSCTRIQMLQKFGERVALEKYFPISAKHSPYLVDELYDYFLGGIEDMAVWTQRIWKYFTYALRNGQQNCKMDKNPLFIRCNETSSLGMRKNSRVLKNGFYVKPNFHGSSLDDIQVEKSGRGLVFKPSPRLKEKMAFVAKKVAEIKSGKQKNKDLIKQMRIGADNYETPSAVFTIGSDYAKLGSAFAVADLNNDGNEDLVIGCPGMYSSSHQQNGMVYILFGTDQGLNTSQLDISLAADVAIPGPEDPHNAHSQFGSSLAVLDFDKDGKLDIAVGAPSYGSVNLTYTGKVFVYSPIDNRRYALRGAVSCKEVYCNLGTTLTTGDVNSDLYNDLIIGSPFAPGSGEQRGVVGVLHADTKYAGKLGLSLKLADEFSMTGTQNYGWLGRSVAVKKFANRNQTYMVVGEPTFRECAQPDCTFNTSDVQAIGQVHFMVSDSNGIKPGRKVQGSEQFQMFGSQVEMGRPFGEFTDVVAIAATGHDAQGHISHIPRDFEQTGSVFLYNFTNPYQHPITVFNGDRKYGRFGAQIKFADLNKDGFDDLIIGAPLRTNDFTEEIHGAQQGRVFVYLGGSGFPKGDATTNCGLLHIVDPCPGEKAYKELAFEENYARFGSKIAVVRSKDKVQLVATAEHSSKGARLSGAIGLFNF